MKNQQSVMLVTHHFTTGQSELLADFLVKSTYQFFVLRHPFSFAKDVASRVEVYQRGTKIKERSFFPFQIGEFLMYFKDFILTLFVTLKLKRKIDLYIGVDCLNALAGLFLKKLHYAKKVILYSIDLPIERFKTPLLNSLYHKLDVICANNCDSIWNLSHRMDYVRKMYGWKPQNKVPRIVVPAVFDRGLTCESANTGSQHNMVFIGHLKKSQGLQLAIEAFPEILKKAPKARLDIIGTGPYEMTLLNMVKEKGLEDSISFRGFIPNHIEAEKVLCQSGIGIAPYVPDALGITAVADPMKPKVYLSYGLPVIITSVPFFATIINSKEAGIIIDYTEKDFVEAVLKLANNSELYLRYRNNAFKLASEYLPENVFRRALFQTVGLHF